MPSVGSHAGKCVITSNNEKKKQTERAGETDCFNYPLAMLPGNSEKSIVHASYLYKEGSLLLKTSKKKKKKIRMNALVTPACPVGSENRCMGKLEGKKSCEKQTCLGNE